MMLTTDPFDQPQQLTVCIDLKDPYCHLALPGTLAMLERTGQSNACRWLPFERHAMHAPKPPQANEDRSAGHYRRRDLYRDRELRHYAAALQLPFDRLYENPDTTLFASALLWLQTNAVPGEVLHRFLRGYFKAYWSAAIRADDGAACAQMLDASGADGASWQATAPAAAAVDEQRQALRAGGLFNTPAYLLQGEVYYGRAHLPLIEAILGTPSNG